VIGVQRMARDDGEFTLRVARGSHIAQMEHKVYEREMKRLEDMLDGG